MATEHIFTQPLAAFSQVMYCFCYCWKLLAVLIIRGFLWKNQKSLDLSLWYQDVRSQRTSLTLRLHVLLISTSKVRAYGSQSGDMMVPCPTALFGLGRRSDSTRLNDLSLHIHEVRHQACITISQYAIWQLRRIVWKYYNRVTDIILGDFCRSDA